MGLNVKVKLLGAENNFFTSIRQVSNKEFSILRYLRIEMDMSILPHRNISACFLVVVL